MAKKDNLLIGVFDCQTLGKRFTDTANSTTYCGTSEVDLMILNVGSESVGYDQ